MPWARRHILALLILVTFGAARAAEDPALDLVAIPAPHSGQQPLSDVPARMHGLTKARGKVAKWA